jgi:hypothetical protein
MRLASFCGMAFLLLTAPVAALPLLDPADGAVFSQETSRDLLNQCSREVPGPVQGTWQPSKTQIQTLEESLPKALDEALAKRGEHPDRSAIYMRQYAGFVVGGHRIIYVNAFPREHLGSEQSSTPDWRLHATLVCDGGSAFFGVEFDPDKGTFSHFAFNGIG